MNGHNIGIFSSTVSKELEPHVDTKLIVPCLSSAEEVSLECSQHSISGEKHSPIFPQKRPGNSTSTRPPAPPENRGRIGTNFGSSDFWDHFGGQTSVMINRSIRQPLTNLK